MTENETQPIPDTNPDDSSGDALLEALNVEVPASVAVEPPKPVFTTPIPEDLVPGPADWTRPTGPEFFKCRKGHVVEGYSHAYLTVDEMDPRVVATSGPICKICQLEFFKAKFGTTPYKPPGLQ